MSTRLTVLGLTIAVLVSSYAGRLRGQCLDDYLVRSAEALRANGADYLVVAADGFIEPLLPLFNYRATSHTVRVLPLSFVYAHFDTTLLSRPEAIKAAIRFCWGNWQPRPRFVLLVGDANEQGGPTDFCPSPRFPKFSYPYAFDLQEHASDNWYVEMTDTAYLPVMAIGRLPIRTADQAQTVVSKIMAYEQAVANGSYSRTATVISAGEYSPFVRRDVWPYFTSGALRLNAIEMDGLSAAAVADSIVNAFNSGSFVVAVFTHAHFLLRVWWGWCGDGPFCVAFSADHVSRLLNAPRFPFLLSFG